MDKTLSRMAIGGLLFLTSNAAGQVTVEQIRERALAAFRSNAEIAQDVVYSRDAWVEFVGLKLGTFELSSKRRLRTPKLLSHVGSADGRLVDVVDGWEDRWPLRASDLAGKHRFVPDELPLPESDLVVEFLSPERHFVLANVVSEHGHRAYVLRSTRRAPPPILPAVPYDAGAPCDPSAPSGSPHACAHGVVAKPAGSAAKCPTGMDATLYLDYATYFPLNVEAIVVESDFCSTDLNDELNVAGTMLRFHEVQVRGNDPSGIRREMYVVDQTAFRHLIGKGNIVGIYKQSPAARAFFLPDGFQRSLAGHPTELHLNVRSRFQFSSSPAGDRGNATTFALQPMRSYFTIYEDRDERRLSHIPVAANVGPPLNSGNQNGAPQSIGDDK